MRRRYPALLILAMSLLVDSSISNAQQMIYPGDEWQVATPESVLVDSTKLQAAIDRLKQQVASVDEMTIVKNGRVIWQGEDPHQPLRTWSVTKSFASTLVGWAVDQGLLDLDAYVKDYIPEMAELYPDVTIRHLATHTNGYLAEGEVYPFVQLPPDPFVPAAPLFESPGSVFAYNDSGYDQMMNVLSVVTGQSGRQLFQDHFGDKIGIRDEDWEWGEYTTSDGRKVLDGGGAEDKSVIMSANDLARFGHLFLNQGEWTGQRLISTDWINEATQVQVPASTPSHPNSIGGPGSYGLGWWIKPDFFAALGYELNWLLVSPSTGYVVARASSERRWYDDDNFFRQISDAIIPAVWDEQGDGHWNEHDPSTGKVRWRTEDGLVPDIYPTSQAIVRSNTVSVGDEMEVRDLTIESGEVSILETGSLRLTYRTNVDSAGNLSILGSFEASRMTVDGAMLVAGPTSVERLTVDTGTLQLANSDHTFAVTNSLRVNADGDIQFLIDEASWKSPLQLSEGSRATLSGDLTLALAPSLDPETLEGVTIDLFDWNGRLPTTSFERIVVPSRLELETSQLYTSGAVTILSVLNQPTISGDFDGSTSLDTADVDALSARTAIGSTDRFYDLDGDGILTKSDLLVWVHDLKQTWFGDANLDGEFNSRDLVEVFQAGEYETEQEVGWAEGDWNGDGVFGSGDLIFAFQDGGYEKGPRPSFSAVPEPSSLVLMLIGMLTATRCCERQRAKK